MTRTTMRRRLAVGTTVTALMLGGGAMQASAASPADSTGRSDAAAVVEFKPGASSATERRRCYTPNCYAAMSMAWRDAAYASFYNTRTRRAAVRKAHRRCRANSNRPASCRRMGSVGNGCMAIAYRWNGRQVTAWRSGYGRTHRAARRHARKKLNYHARIRGSVCTARNY